MFSWFLADIFGCDCTGTVALISISVLSLFRPDVHLLVPFVSCFQTYSRLPVQQLTRVDVKVVFITVWSMIR